MKLATLLLIASTALASVAPTSSADQCVNCIGGSSTDIVKSSVCGNGTLKLSLLTWDGKCEVTGETPQGQCICQQIDPCPTVYSLRWNVPGASKIEWSIDSPGGTSQTGVAGSSNGFKLGSTKLDCYNQATYTLTVTCLTGATETIRSTAYCSSCTDA